MPEDSTGGLRESVDRVLASFEDTVKQYRLPLTVLALVVLAVVPLVLPAYPTRIVALSLFGVILAGSFNLISGFTGYISFGQGAFIGVGAYTGAMLIKAAGAPLVVAILVSGLLAALIALVLGFPLLRLRGHYFAIATFVIQLALAALISSLSELGGGQGLVSLSVWPYDYYYYAFAIIAVALVATTYFVRQSYFGLRLLAINSNEIQAETLGVPTNRYKLQAFVLSAVFPGMAGAVWANYIGYINPGTALDPHLSVRAVLYTLTGGLGTVFGPVIGALSLSLLNNTLGSQFLELDSVIFGLLIVVVILFMPNGILGLLNRSE
ncbi:MAG: branched-chain amino acid ABC transporter permease [Halorientalis sp.]